MSDTTERWVVELHDGADWVTITIAESRRHADLILAHHAAEGSTWRKSGEPVRYRAVRETVTRTVIAEIPADLEAVEPGGNAEDCRRCAGTNPPYPFICPGHPAKESA